ncbi:hypothetical protein ADIS_0607 [Lunatimonas lonarensis]|uniref:Uncharacterized protein n=1 Tax=Lunatimonas lonarensis TaxID=1232681 RepID=R7ZX21_9BACT|nr:hypothetical protein ADIS_0607 [Lunatimonas lonarensis]
MAEAYPTAATWALKNVKVVIVNLMIVIGAMWSKADTL